MFNETNDPVFEDGVIEIPQPDYPDETPAEALEAIILDALKLAKEMGKMEEEEITEVLEKIMSERLDDYRRSTFKLHDKD